MKIFRSEKIDSASTAENTLAEEWTTDYKNYLHFNCSDGKIAAKEVQWEGKKKMQIEEFLRGFRP